MSTRETTGRFVHVAEMFPRFLRPHRDRTHKVSARCFDVLAVAHKMHAQVTTKSTPKNHQGDLSVNRCYNPILFIIRMYHHYPVLVQCITTDRSLPTCRTPPSSSTVHSLLTCTPLSNKSRLTGGLIPLPSKYAKKNSGASQSCWTDPRSRIMRLRGC